MNLEPVIVFHNFGLKMTNFDQQLIAEVQNSSFGNLCVFY